MQSCHRHTVISTTSIFTYLRHFLGFSFILPPNQRQSLQRSQYGSEVLSDGGLPDVRSGVSSQSAGVELQMTTSERRMMLSAEELSELREAVDGRRGQVEILRSHQIMEKRGKCADERSMVEEQILRRRRVDGLPGFAARNHESGLRGWGRLTFEDEVLSDCSM